MRITSIIRVVVAMVVVAMVVVGGFLLYLYVDHEHYLVGLSSTSYSEIAMRLFQDTREEKAPWWKEVLCRRGGHQTELPGHKAVPLKMLFRDITPEMNNNIFLMDTSCNPFPNYRVWCSVESWARQNPDRQVWFLLTSGQLEGGHALTSLLLQQYTNIHLVTADVMDLFKDTPLLSLLNSRRWTDSWPIELMSDMLRVLVLWWWGGVYSDTDVISLRALTLPPNSLGFEHAFQIGSAFYSFRARHPTLLKLMEDMQQHFRPWDWGSIGPRAISRVMVKECGMKLLELIQKAPVTCSGNITLFPTSTFFPVRYNLFQYYFKPGGGKHFNVTFGRSVALHFWNKMSKNKTVKVNSNSVYEVAAKRFCPITYRTATTHSNVF